MCFQLIQCILNERLQKNKGNCVTDNCHLLFVRDAMLGSAILHGREPKVEVFNFKLGYFAPKQPVKHEVQTDTSRVENPAQV